MKNSFMRFICGRFQIKSRRFEEALENAILVDKHEKNEEMHSNSIRILFGYFLFVNI
jgi:hypothetical protein